MKTILFGAGSDLGVHMDGAHLGPTQLINDLSSFFKGESISLIQEEHILKSRNLSDKRKNKYEVMEFNRKLYKKILEEQEKETIFPITIGGDSTVSIASALAASKTSEEIGVIVFSAHTDYNTVDTTITGNIHGITLASINGQCNEFNDFFEGVPPLPTKTVVYGARSIDDGEKETIKYSGLTVFSTDEVKADIDNQLVKKAFDIATYRTKGVHVIFDLGLIDPDVSTGVSVPSIDGIDEEKAMQLIDEILNHYNHIISFDLVEFNPLRDIARKTEQIAVNILAKVIKKAQDKVVIDLKKSTDTIAEIIKASEMESQSKKEKDIATQDFHRTESTGKEVTQNEIIPGTVTGYTLEQPTPPVEEINPVEESIQNEVIPSAVTEYTTEQPTSPAEEVKSVEETPQNEIALGTITGYTIEEPTSSTEEIKTVEESIVTENQGIAVTPIDTNTDHNLATTEETPPDLGYIIAPPIINSIITETTEDKEN